MKVLFDHQIFDNQVYGGISRYHYELLRYLPQADVNAELSLRFSNNYYLKNKDVSNHSQFFPSFNLKLRNDYIRKKNRQYTEEMLRRSNFDIFHPTYYENYFLEKGLLKNKPFVVTVHDMTLEKLFPEDTDLATKKQLIQQADKVIAISENTKKDLMEYIQIPSDKISVIYHGCNEGFGQNLSAPQGIGTCKYILYVGARYAYKNFVRLLNVFGELSAGDKDLMLLCTGQKFTNQECSMLRKLHVYDKVKAISCNDSELAWLYKNARMFVFPSLYEGFGIPILEAFAMSCPVAMSNTSCFPEIAKEAAVYFDPYDEASMYDTLHRLLNDTSLRNDLIDRARYRLSFFSWIKTVSQMSDLYKSII